MDIINFFLKDYRYDPLQDERVNCPKCEHHYVIQMKRYDDEIQLRCPECQKDFLHQKMYY